MAIKTIKTNYYYELLAGMKKGRGKRRSKPPTGEHNFINLGHEQNPGEIASNPSILRKDAGTGNNTIPVRIRESSSLPNPLKLEKKTGKFQALFRNISLVYGKKIIKNFPLAKLVFKNGELAGKKFFIYNINPTTNPGGYIKIGRIPQKGDRFFISIADRTVSRTHAKIVYLNGDLIIVNYSEVNPTQLNGKPIPVNASTYIPDGSTIKIGVYELEIEKVKSE